MHVKSRRIAASSIALLILSLGAVTMLFPFLWMVSTSVKTFAEIFVTPPRLIPKIIQFDTYVKIWTETDILSGFKNSAIIASFVLLFGTFSSSLAAFAFAKLRLPHGDRLFLVLLSTIMLPFAVVMIPQFVFFTKIGWVDTLLPLIVPGLFGNIGVIFFLKQFMGGIPDELFDAGRMDGCGPFGLYRHIMLPAARPAISVQVILMFMGVWNDFFGPIIYINSPKKMPIQAVIASLNSFYVTGSDMALIMTASLIALLPILIVFIVFQRYFIETLTFTGLK
jgi:multiple sugar transport system permease protein